MNQLEGHRTALSDRLQERSIGSDAEPMARYMKNRFRFLGIKSKQRRTAQRPLLAAAKRADPDEVLELAVWCWRQPYREFQYVACDLLRANVDRLEPSAITVVRALLEDQTWWDTVDPLATRTVGPLVKAHSRLGSVMDDWINDDNFWLARVAILHQLTFKEDTDPDRLFAYCTVRTEDQEFFVRKAIGWALREYSKVNASAVRRFLDSNPGLSHLSVREASKYL